MLLCGLGLPSIVLVMGLCFNLSDLLAAVRLASWACVVLANEKVLCGPVTGHREAFGSLCPALAGTEAIGDFPRRGFGSRRSLLYARSRIGLELPLTVDRRL